MKPASIPSKRGIGKWGLPAILLCGLAGFFATGLHQLISWETVARHYAEISHFIEQNRTASYLGFVLFYTAVVAFSLPIASLLTLAAGALLGWPAIGLIVVAATAGASLLFIAARGLFRDVLRARAGPFFAKLEAGFTKNAFGYLLFLRLMPAAPFWAVNILPAFSGMRLAPFIGATAIGIIPGTSVYVAVGRGFDHLLAQGKTPNLAVLNTPHIWLPLAGLALLALLPTVYRQIRPTGKKDQPHDPS
ncbi:MAG: TVP38/TMEM64 family protein [Candidatus Puniceispirillaceae bacterium]|nr:VTT domain-containing protein [Pseudomonadota bacterium]MDA0846471.1 VTT domain-containing protein [Pseudomonadota bacterium]